MIDKDLSIIKQLKAELPPEKSIYVTKNIPLMAMTVDHHGKIVCATPGKIRWTKERLSVVARWVLAAMEHEKASPKSL